MNSNDFYQKLSLWVSVNFNAWPEILQKKDWLRSSRKVQGLKGIELAEKLGVSPARVSMMERDEEKGTLTLNSLQRAAHALDCELAYLLIPKQSLKQSSSHSTNKPRVKMMPVSFGD